MTIHTCERCGYSTDRKSNLTSHTRRKNPCKRKVEKELLENKLVKRTTCSDPNNPKLDYLDQKISKPVQVKEKILAELTCKYCEKNYSTKSNLVKHHRICKIKISKSEYKIKLLEIELVKKDIQVEAQAAEIKRKDLEILKLLTDTKHSTDSQVLKDCKNSSIVTTEIKPTMKDCKNSDNSVNKTNNITIAMFGASEMIGITEKEIVHVLSGGSNSVKNLLTMLLDKNQNVKSTEKGISVYGLNGKEEWVEMQKNPAKNLIVKERARNVVDLSSSDQATKLLPSGPHCRISETWGNILAEDTIEYDVDDNKEEKTKLVEKKKIELFKEIDNRLYR